MAAAESLSDCVLMQLNLKYATNWNNYSFSKYREGNAVVVMSKVGGTAGYQWHLTFVPLGGNQTRVEVRSTHNIWGGENYPSDVFESVDKCAVRAS